MISDQRSVGELLLDADFHARTLLLDVVGDDAPALLRGWGEVVQAAGDLWSELPQLSASPVDGATMQRLQSMAQGMHRHQLRHDWPGEGHPDSRLLNIAENFLTAAQLVDTRDRARDTWPPAVRADVDAVKMRVMHTMYVAAHGVGVAVRQHVQDTEAQFGSARLSRNNRAIPRGRDAEAQMMAFEQLTGAHVGARFPRILRGEHQHPVGAGRLHQAMVSWDIQAHRVASADPTAANVHVIGRTQAFLAAANLTMLAAAAQIRHLDNDLFRFQLAPALETSQTSWSQLARHCEQLSDRRQRPDAALVRSAGEVRAAVAEIAYDTTVWASPATIAARVDMDDTVVTLHQGIAAAVEAAVIARDALSDDRMTGSARGIAAWQREFIAAASSSPAAVPTGSWVDVGDITQNRQVPLSADVRSALDGVAEAVTTDTRRTLAIASNIRQSLTVPAAPQPVKRTNPAPWPAPTPPRSGPTP